MFTTTPLAPDQIFIKTDSIQPGLQPLHVIQILLCTEITDYKQQQTLFTPNTTLQGQ